MCTEEFYRLSSQCDLSMMEVQQEAKYISIQERVILHDMFFVDDAHNKGMKIERLQSRASPFKNVEKKTSNNIRTQQSFTLGDRPLGQKVTGTATANPVTTAAPTTMGKENSYAKPSVGKCYKYGEPRNKSNEFPRRRQVNMTDYEDEDEVKIGTELEKSDFTEEHGESATCMVQYLLCNQKTLTPHNGIKSSTQCIRSKTRCATSSSIMKVARTLFPMHQLTT